MRTSATPGPPEPAGTAVPRAGWAGSAGRLVDQHDVLLLDLDGVVYVGSHAVPHAVEVLATARAAGVRFGYVTNNAARAPDVVAAHLVDLGLSATPEDVVTSAQVAARMLAAGLPPGAAVLTIGADGLRAAITGAGLRPVHEMAEQPAAVVQGFSPELDWSMLLEACVAVRAGLPWVATNPDRTVPTARGLAPGNGAFVDVVRGTTGVQPRYAGKPYRAIVDEAVRRTGARRPLVVGDRLDTDLAAARVTGLPGLLVLTGVSAVRDLLAAGPGERPHHLAADLRGLGDVHAAPVRQGVPDDRSWVGGTHAEVRVRRQRSKTGTALTLDAGPPSGDPALALEAIRVMCAAVWDSADEGDDSVGLEQVRQELSPWSARHGWDR